MNVQTNLSTSYHCCFKYFSNFLKKLCDTARELIHTNTVHAEVTMKYVLLNLPLTPRIPLAPFLRCQLNVLLVLFTHLSKS